MSLSGFGKKHKGNKTGYVGVSYDKKSKKYVAEIRYRGKRYRLGHFNTAKEAHRARESKVEELLKL
jgi:hypothetical protein